MLDKNVRLGGDHADRQEAARRPAAARLRRADRHAGDAGIRGLRSVDQGRATIRRRRSSCWQASGYLARQAGQVHDPDDARLQAQGLRDDPGDRRHVAQGRHRGRRSRSTRSPSTTSCAPPTSWRRPPSTIGATRSAIRPPRPASPCSARSPHSVWDGQDVIDAMIGPLWGEKDEAKRIAGWKAVDKLHRREGLRASRCSSMCSRSSTSPTSR